MNLFDPIRCVSCGKNSDELEKRGIAMNIPLEKCYACLKRERKEETKEVPVLMKAPQRSTIRQREAERLVFRVYDKYEGIIKKVESGEEPNESHTDLASFFLDVLLDASRVMKL